MLEDQICKQFVGQLRVLDTLKKLNGIYFHVPNEISGNTNPFFGKRLKDIGKLSGTADYIFMWENGCACLEAKSSKGTLTTDQNKFKERCTQFNIKYDIFRTPQSGIDKLIEWGFIKL